MATTYTEYAKFNYVHGVSSSANVEPRIFASGSSESAPKLYISQSTGIVDLAGANSLGFAGDSGTGTVNLGTQTFTVAGTSNEVETSAGSQTLTVGLPTNVTVAGNLTLGGNIVGDADENKAIFVATTTATNTITLGGGGQVVCAGDLDVADDVTLSSDSAVLSLGDGGDATLTHDGTTGLTIAATPISVNSTGDLTLDATTTVILDSAAGDISLKDNGTAKFEFDLDGTANEVALQNGTDGDDLVFKLDAGSTEIMRLDDSASSMLMASTKKIEFESANKFIHSDGTDLQVSSSTDVVINAGEYIYLDARLGANVLQANGTTYGYLGKTQAGTLMLSGANASQHLMFKAGLNGNIITSASANIILESNAGKVLYHDDGTMYGSIQQSGGDMLFYDAGETEIFRLDASADSLLMASTKKIEFNDATQYIGASSAADLDIAATTDVNIDCTTLDVNAAANISGQTVFQTGIVPDANDGAYLGQSGTGFSDLFLADGAVINVNAGNSTLTGGSALWQSNVAFQATRLRIDSAADYIDVSTDMQLVAAADILLDPAGGDVKVDGNMLPNAADGGTLGSAALEWSDLFLADSSAIKFGDDQDTTLTHTDGTGLTLNSTNKLCFQDTATFINSSADGQLDIDADVEVEIATATLDIDATTAVAITSPSVVIDSGTSDKPVLEIKNTNADANPATLKFNKDSASPADSDELGEIDFYGDDSGGNSDLMAKILVVQTDVTATEEDAKIAFKVRVGGSLKTMEWGNAAGLVLPNDATNGIITAHSYVTYSDETLKTNINPLDNALDTVKSLRGVSYEWKNDGKSDIGFIAQEVNEVVPQVVRANRGEGNHYGLDYARLTAVLVEAVKELAAKVENNNK